MMLILFVIIPLAALLGVSWLLYTAQTISSRIRGKCYDDIEQIPANFVGLVLGCARYLSSGRPNLYFAYRIEAAAALFRAGKVELLLASGASFARDELDEATSMKDALIEAGVPAERCTATRETPEDQAGLKADAIITLLQRPVDAPADVFHNIRAGLLAVSYRGIIDQELHFLTPSCR